MAKIDLDEYVAAEVAPRFVYPEADYAALEARCATLTAEVMHYTAGTPHPRIAELEALVREAREWIATDTDALEECHKPYDLDNPIDVETAQEVDDRRTWLTRTTAETK